MKMSIQTKKKRISFRAESTKKMEFKEAKISCLEVIVESKQKAKSTKRIYHQKSAKHFKSNAEIRRKHAAATHIDSC